MADRRGSPARGAGVGHRGSSADRPTSPTPIAAVPGILPTRALPSHVALVEQLVSFGIPARIAADSVEAELVDGRGWASSEVFDERVLDRALAANTVAGGDRGASSSGGGAAPGPAAGGGRGASSSGGGAAPGPAADGVGTSTGTAQRGGGVDLSGWSGGDGGLVASPASPADNQAVVVISDSEDAGSQPLPMAAEGAAPMAVGGLGTHMQTAADLLAASSLAPPFGAGPASASGMNLALSPPAVSHPLLLAPVDPATAATEVSLIVDTRDTRGSGVSRAAFFARLSAEPGLSGRVLERQLPTGDALLVARVTPHGSAAVEGAVLAGTELVLDVLIERKTAEDLVASIKEARLVEQAYFMAASGRPSLVCVVEGDVAAAVGNDAELGQRVAAYLAELDVSVGFTVKRTNDVSETAAYYASLVKYRGMRLGSVAGLTACLAAKRDADETSTVVGLSGCHSYENWTTAVMEMRAGSSLQQLWALQLHVLPGVGPARINNILAAGFQTPAALAAAYRDVKSVAEGRGLLAQLTPPAGRAPITASLSSFFYDLFTSDSYGTRLA